MSDDPKTHKDYIDAAKKTHEITDLEERVGEAVKLSELYQSNLDNITTELTEVFYDREKVNPEKVNEISKKIYDARNERETNFSDIETEDFMKEALGTIMPGIGYGVENNNINFQIFEGYCAVLDNFGRKTGNREFIGLFGKVQNLVKSGKGDEAIAAIKDTMKMHILTKANQAIEDYLLPQDHEAFRNKMGSYLTKKTNKALGERGKIYESQVMKDVGTAFGLFASKEHDKMKELYGDTDYTKTD